VKALPHLSKKHGETVCCAGVTAEGEWRRLFPVRFRHLSAESSFKRWDWVTFKYVRPTSDPRRESCRVFEDTIAIGKKLPKEKRADFLGPVILPSVKAAADRGDSLALIRPLEPRFSYKAKSAAQLDEERESYRLAAAQKSFFDDELAALEPSPYEFRFRFRDADAPHDYSNGDWEAHAMFYNARNKLGMSEQEALDWMDHRFNVEYPQKGMAFAVGNMAAYPKIWQLLGVLRLDESKQPSFL
jgi:hypothetical protein